MNMKIRKKIIVVLTGIAMLLCVGIVGVGVKELISINQNQEISKSNIEKKSSEKINKETDKDKKSKSNKAQIIGDRDEKESAAVNESNNEESLDTVNIGDSYAGESDLEQMLAEMTLEEKVAQMFFITPDALAGGIVTQTGVDYEQLYQKYPVGGFIMMQENIISPDQIMSLNNSLIDIGERSIGLTPFLGVDEEGGTVARIASNSNFPVENVGNMNEIGYSGDSSKAYNVGVQIGTYLKTYGFNTDFAPDADVWTNSANTVVQYRAFGSDPQQTAEMVKQAVEGFHSQGICTALKHFPGHGNTGEDSHMGFAYSQKSVEELRQCELLPFQMGIEAGSEFVMVGHISLPSVTGSEVPATLSSVIITDLLRNELEYKGIIITDAMNMGAIANNYSSADAAVQAIQAGVDMVLMPTDFIAAYEGVLSAVQSGSISEDRINDSVRRIIFCKMNMKVN